MFISPTVLGMLLVFAVLSFAIIATAINCFGKEETAPPEPASSPNGEVLLFKTSAWSCPVCKANNVDSSGTPSSAHDSDDFDYMKESSGGRNMVICPHCNQSFLVAEVAQLPRSFFEEE